MQENGAQSLGPLRRLVRVRTRALRLLPYLLTDLLTGTIPKTAGVAPLPSMYEATFELVQKRPEPYREALRLLLDTSFDDARERWGAEDRLIELIRWVQDPFIDPEEPHRVPKVRRLLDTIETASRTLTSRVGEFDDLAEYLMHRLPPDLANPSKLPEYLQRAQISRAHADPRFNESELLESLFALQKACRLIRETFLDERHSSARLATVGLTNPKLHLVTMAASLFAEFRPTALRATLRGPFDKFCAALYELIAGEDSKGPGVGLRRYVDFVAPLMRRLHDLSERRIYLMFPGPYRHFRDGVDERILRLNAEMAAVWTELEAGPFRRRQRKR